MSRGRLVTVVIPTYNCERYLAEAVDSVLRQAVAFTEVIVVDDGSDDGTEALMKRLPTVRYVRQAHAGAGAARNQGAQIAQGEFLAFLDSDDVWEPHKLARQLRFLDEHADCDMVFGHVEEFYSPELSEEECARLSRRPEAMPFYSAGTMLVRCAGFRRAGEFTATWSAGEFVDWYLRATDRGLSAGMLPDVVLRRRIHRGHLGNRRQVASQDYVRIVRQGLARRRAAAGAPRDASAE